MRTSTAILACVLVAAAPGVGAGSSARGDASAGAAQGSPASLQSLLARVDAEWPRRDQPGRMQEIRAMLEQAEKAAPEDYGLLWRMARLYFWLSDDPALSNDEKSRLGKKAWEYGDRASARNPGGVEGWYFAAVGMGNYSLGIGVLKALGEGIEGKFRERLTRAEKIDPTFYAGGVHNAWGRFYFKLPWPKYDARRSERALQKAIEMNPANVRARVFLAELYIKEDHPKEARELLEEAAAHEPGSYDVPEERRSRARARELLSEMKR
jgi:tetratricopeptide (TPR) repeat protein